MKLAEVFTSLAYGELSQVFLGSQSEGELTESNHPMLVSHINLGLTSLYKRFPLKEGRLTLLLQEGRLTYPLTPAFALSNTQSAEPVKYIDDTGSPFLGDLFKIERVYDEEGTELGLNDEADLDACSTPSLSVLRVPEDLAVTGTVLTVVYRANHPILTLVDNEIDPFTTELELPYTHLEALLYFVASRVHNPIGMANEFHAGNNWAAKYEGECQKLETLNLRVDQGGQVNRLERNGWV